jgi:hypothetical protein
MLPGPGAILAGPTFQEWLEATTRPVAAGAPDLQSHSLRRKYSHRPPAATTISPRA